MQVTFFGVLSSEETAGPRLRALRALFSSSTFCSTTCIVGIIPDIIAVNIFLFRLTLTLPQKNRTLHRKYGEID